MIDHVSVLVSDLDRSKPFYRAAIAAGGRSSGEPGPRPLDHASYYGAFIFDPDGHNIEAVRH
jgi:catechol 2,3-dioxygenase-like lactoylglutathione lyase family enzyme